MKIVQLTAENIKRLIAVEIRPDGNLVQITGKNGQGKTSVLDSIWWAIGGAKHIQSHPIRRGANSAKIKLDMGEIIVTRTFKRTDEGGFTTKLEVVGAVKGTPQNMLDSLLDSLAFDPLAFARMDAKAQFEALKKYVPDVDFAKIAAENSIDFANRAEKNRKAKEARIQADQILITDKTPTERIDESALVQKLADAGKHNGDVQLRGENRKTILNGVPFDQASDAEQLRVSCAIAMAGNPTLKVIRVRDGSLMDEQSLEMLAKMAEEREFQVWIERVEPGKVGFIIEDGHAVKAEAVAEEI